jgi:hypothetical protein
MNISILYTNAYSKENLIAYGLTQIIVSNQISEKNWMAIIEEALILFKLNYSSIEIKKLILQEILNPPDIKLPFSLNYEKYENKEIELTIELISESIYKWIAIKNHDKLTDGKLEISLYVKKILSLFASHISQLTKITYDKNKELILLTVDYFSHIFNIQPIKPIAI